MDEYAGQCRALAARLRNGRGRAVIIVEIEIDDRAVDVNTVLRCSETARDAERIVAAYEAIEGSIARIVGVAVAKQFQEVG